MDRAGQRGFAAERLHARHPEQGSNIESGKIELAAEPVSLAATLESLTKTFQPAAEQKRLRFSAAVDPNTPDVMETDPQRLGQNARLQARIATRGD